MNGKVILENTSLESQTREAIENFASHFEIEIEDNKIDLGSVVLQKSSDGSKYYVVTAKRCSCPSFVYRGLPCKHIREHFSSLSFDEHIQVAKSQPFRPLSEEAV